MDNLSTQEFINQHVGTLALQQSLVNFGQLRNQEFVEPIDLFGGWLHEGSATLLHGATGLGKSRFAMSLACCVAGGGQFAGWSTPSDTGKNVLYIDGEMGFHSLRDMANQLGQAVGADLDQLTKRLQFISVPDASDKLKDFNLGDKGFQGLVLDLIDKHDIDLVIVDNIRTLVYMDDENTKEGWQPLNDWVIKLRTFSTVILVHHDNRQGGFSGSGHASTIMDYRIQLNEHNATHALRGAGCAFTVDFEKVRRSRTVAHGTRAIGLHPTEGWLMQNDRQTEFNKVHDAAISGRYTTQRELANACGINAPKLNKLLTDYDPDGAVKTALNIAKHGEPVEPTEVDADFTALDSFFDG